MEWEKLLSLKRHGDNFKRKRIDQDETRLGFDVDGSVDDMADMLRESLEEREDEGDEPNLENTYIQYDGDVVQLSEAWKARFQLCVDVE